MSGVPSLPVYIMAGGKSSRFGSDKARALLHGTPLLIYVAQALKNRSQSLTVVAESSGSYDDLGYPTIGDMTPGLGPLGGLQTALHHCKNTTHEHPSSDGWFLFTSCDMMGLQADWVDMLWAGRVSGKLAVAFGPEPWDSLFALYHIDLEAEIEQRIAQQQRAMWRMMEANAQAVPHPMGWDRVSSINTPEALARYAKKLSSHS